MGIKARRRARSESRASSPAPVRGTRLTLTGRTSRGSSRACSDATRARLEVTTARTARERRPASVDAGRAEHGLAPARTHRDPRVVRGRARRRLRARHSHPGAVRLPPSPPRRRARRRHLPTGLPRRPARKLRARGRTPPPSAPPTSRSADPFRALGLEREGATPDDVARAYRALAFRWHPDKNGQSDESHAAMQTINAARAACLSILRDVERYDSDDPDDTGSNPAGDGDEDDDKVGAARRAQTRSRAYTRALGRERARVRAERTPRTKIQTPNRRPTPRRTRIGDVEASIAIAFLAIAILMAAHIDSTGCSGSARLRPTLDCYLDRMDTETSEVARAARASAGLVLLQLLLYRFPPLLEVGRGRKHARYVRGGSTIQAWWTR